MFGKVKSRTNSDHGAGLRKPWHKRGIVMLHRGYRGFAATSGEEALEGLPYHSNQRESAE